ncbi:DUF6843 domain-containing protein [Paenibacillus mendelii]|uniref:DUF6843 domain-containing protein n=1 Tax=Paenibacillus mendelii TaxID=206163 RepID=A0ABV6J6J5_9BACL
MQRKGKRTAIDTTCVNIRGTGASSSNGVEPPHTDIKVTHSVCGEDFRLNGS